MQVYKNSYKECT